jgi:hypothetical protein
MSDTAKLEKLASLNDDELLAEIEKYRRTTWASPKFGLDQIRVNPEVNVNIPNIKAVMLVANDGVITQYSIKEFAKFLVEQVAPNITSEDWKTLEDLRNVSEL